MAHLFPGFLWQLCPLLFAFLTWQVAVDRPLRRADERFGRAIADGPLPDVRGELRGRPGLLAVVDELFGVDAGAAGQ